MIDVARPKIVLPALTRGMVRDIDRGIRRRGGERWHPTMGVGVVLDPDGSVASMGEWERNTLLDEGEQDMTNVYFLQTADLAKYLALLKGAAPAETDTMAFLAGATNGEVTTPATNGYNRQAVANTDWGAPALNGGDYQTTAAQKTFGPNTGASWVITSVSLVGGAGALTGQTSGSGKHLINTPTSATTTIATSQSFFWTQTTKAQ